jgi:hypothetical protein
MWVIVFALRGYVYGAQEFLFHGHALGSGQVGFTVSNLYIW